MDPIFQNFLNSLPPRSPVDTTATRSYQQLGRQFADTLQRQIPGNFQGAGIQTLPTNLLTEASRIAEMPSGAAREAARNQLASKLQIQANLQGQPPRISGMGAGGALRAPSIGSNLNRGLGFTVNPSSPYSGSPYALDSALRRQSGITDLSRQLRSQKLTLTPGATPSFSLDNPLTKLKGNARYLWRQGQGLLQRAQSFGPTALNPLASRSPTTTLGKIGSSLNPLNPANLRSLGIGLGISTFVPDDSALKGNLEILAYTPGPWYNKLGATILFGATDAGPKDEMALIEQQRQAGIKPYGGDASIRNEEGKYWAGRNWGFQSAESFNKLYSANLPTGTVPPVANLPSDYKETELAAGAGFPAAALAAPVVQPEIDTSLPLVGNIGPLTGNALYRAAREAGYDNILQLGLSQWANYHQGRLPQATAELAATVESEETKARKFLDTYLKKGDQ